LEEPGANRIVKRLAQPATEPVDMGGDQCRWFRTELNTVMGVADQLAPTSLLAAD